VGVLDVRASALKRKSAAPLNAISNNIPDRSLLKECHLDFSVRMLQISRAKAFYDRFNLVRVGFRAEEFSGKLGENAGERRISPASCKRDVSAMMKRLRHLSNFEAREAAPD
jgi:hypothetical protein